jgi:hypothetical protein
MAKIKVTNRKLYDSKVVDVDVSGLTGSRGSIEITVNETSDLKNEDHRVFTGEHGPNDYQDEYGFILIF